MDMSDYRVWIKGVLEFTRDGSLKWTKINDSRIIKYASEFNNTLVDFKYILEFDKPTGKYNIGGCLEGEYKLIMDQANENSEEVYKNLKELHSIIEW